MLSGGSLVLTKCDNGWKSCWAVSLLLDGGITSIYLSTIDVKCRLNTFAISCSSVNFISPCFMEDTVGCLDLLDNSFKKFAFTA